LGFDLFEKAKEADALADHWLCQFANRGTVAQNVSP